MTPETLTLLRCTVTAHLSEPEHELYVRACEKTGLDPFGRFLYATRDRGQLRVELTIDGFRLTAERTGNYGGQLGPQWCGADGKWLSIWTAEAPPHAARVGILRAGFRKPIWGKAPYSEFVQDSDFWRGMPVTMLAKCAEAQAFRKAFPCEFSGLYAPEELPVASASSRVRTGTPVSVSGASVSQTAPGCPSDRPAINPVRGGAPCDIPAPLRPFVEAGMNRSNVKAAEDFLRGELQAVLGPDAGRVAFQRIWFSIPRTFRTKEEARVRTIGAWCQMWAAVEDAKTARRAA